MVLLNTQLFVRGGLIQPTVFLYNYVPGFIICHKEGQAIMQAKPKVRPGHKVGKTMLMRLANILALMSKELDSTRLINVPH